VAPSEVLDLGPIERKVQDAVCTGVFPGAVLLLQLRGKVALQRAFGYRSLVPEREEMSPETIFDLASLTKVVATTTAAMVLYERGEIGLEDPATRFIPEFGANGKAEVELRHLLTHSSGLPAWVDLRALLPEGIEPGSAEARRLSYDHIHQIPLDYATGSETKYSDLGFILLAEIVERVTGGSLDRFCREEIFEPLGMLDTGFLPLARTDRSYTPDRLAPTEECPWRDEIVRGKVHDENACVMSGIAGHAGLFSTSGDLGRFVRMMALMDDTRVLRRTTIRTFTVRQNLVPGSSRALGWDTVTEDSSCGRLFSPDSFGHTGFTGTSIWIDPMRELAAVLLTNRVHPSRENTQIISFRPQLHDTIVRSLKSSDAPSGEIDLHPFSSSDADELVAFWNRALSLDPITLDVLESKVLLDPNFRREGFLLARAGSRIVGFVLGIAAHHPMGAGDEALDRAWVTMMAVDAGHRRRGIGAGLLESVEAHFRGESKTSVSISPYPSGYFIPGPDLEAHRDAIAFLEAMGYEQGEESLSMDAPLPLFRVEEWVLDRERRLADEGVAIRPYQRGDLLPFLAFMEEVMPRDWTRVARENLKLLTHQRFAPDQILLAVRDGEIVGYSQHEGAHFGPFGVRPEEQGNGIGSVLLARTLEAMQRRGEHCAWVLWTGDRAARLYGRLGFTETRRFVTMSKVIG